MPRTPISSSIPTLGDSRFQPIGAVHERNAGMDKAPVSYLDYLDWERQTHERPAWPGARSVGNRLVGAEGTRGIHRRGAPRWKKPSEPCHQADHGDSCRVHTGIGN